MITYPKKRERSEPNYLHILVVTLQRRANAHASSGAAQYLTGVGVGWKFGGGQRMVGRGGISREGEGWEGFKLGKGLRVYALLRLQEVTLHRRVLLLLLVRMCLKDVSIDTQQKEYPVVTKLPRRRKKAGKKSE